MAWRGLGLAGSTVLALAGCADDGSIPIYIGGERVGGVGGGGAAATTTADGATPVRSVGLGAIFADGGTPVYIGGRRVNCPDGQATC